MNKSDDSSEGRQLALEILKLIASILGFVGISLLATWAFESALLGWGGTLTSFALVLYLDARKEERKL